MPEARLHASGDLAWYKMSELYPPAMQAEMSEADLASSMTTHEEGSMTSPVLQELRYLPGAEAALHAHDVAEIVYILSGTLRFGNRELGAGSSAYVDEHTLYSFTAGDEGAHLLIFMARGEAKYWSGKDFIAKTRQQAAAA